MHPLAPVHAFPDEAAPRPDPLDLLAAEHGFLRAACARLEHVARAERVEPEEARALAAQLRAVLPAHTVDEEDRLFPMLRSLAAPEDEIDAVLDRLALEHDEGGARAPAILALLDRLAAGTEALTGPDRASIGAYAAAKLRHLILETAVLMPLARERITGADRAALAHGMAPRRPQETPS
jgi:hemerythrin-like domain-containing protein